MAVTIKSFFGDEYTLSEEIYVITKADVVIGGYREGAKVRKILDPVCIHPDGGIPVCRIDARYVEILYFPDEHLQQIETLPSIAKMGIT